MRFASGTIFAMGIGITASDAQNRVRLPGDSPVTVVETYQPGTTWAPSPGYIPATPVPTLGGQIQPFDPYATSGPTVMPYPTSPYGVAPQVAPVNPSVPAAPWSFPPPTLPAAPATTWPGTTTLPPANFPPSLSTPGVPPSTFSTPPPGYAPTQPAPWSGPTISPPPWSTPQPPAITPAPVFENGLPWQQTEPLFQDTGAVYTYLYGNKGDELQIHEVDIFSTLVLKSLAATGSSLRVTPGFTFDFLAGPQDVDADLPAQLYAAYINTAWTPQITPQFSADVNFRIGVYSDFESFTSHSIRFPSRGLGVVQLTPTVAFKLGVEYLDRADIKLLPAGGFVWEPDPQTRYDIYFPRPRISKYWTTVGNTDVWWHMGAEYGGGSWTIDRLDAPMLGASDRIDINDIRVFMGIDWDRLGGWDGLFQVGYVFDREIVFTQVPSETTGLKDTFMIRLGLQF